MPPRRRQQFSAESIDQQLQQIHLLDPSSSSENLEQLGPIIKQIHANRQQEAFLRSLQSLIDAKDAEIEKICSDNYQDFISSVSTLFTVKDYTTTLKDKITTLDTSVSQVGRGLVDKKRAVLQSKKTATNLDEAIDSLQACLRVLDVVDRVGEMVKQGKYWAALRSLSEVQNMPSTSLSQTPLFEHVFASLPSLRSQIKDAVSASMKQWLFYIRSVSSQVGRLALEAMEARARRWKSRKERDPLLRDSVVGSAVEAVIYEKTDFNVLNNDVVQVDFKPLLECIHIYTSLDSLHELQRSYQADRQHQLDLIIPTPLPLSQLPALTEEICGFFIVETHVLESTDGFRSDRDVEDLWDAISKRLSSALGAALARETDPNTFLQTKECLLSFIATLESSTYSTESLQSFIMEISNKYAVLLQNQFSRRFQSIIQQDDHLSMYVEKASEVETVLNIVWIDPVEREAISSKPLPVDMPWSQSFYLCCQDLRSFIDKFWQFIEGVAQNKRNAEELLSKSLDSLLHNDISQSIASRLATTSNLSQAALIVRNIEHFQIACSEITRSLGLSLESSPSSFQNTLHKALERIKSIMTAKLDDFFDVSEYDNWTPQTQSNDPSTYLYGLVDWLTTVVDQSLVIKETYKDEAYKAAVAYLAECLMEFLTGRSVPMMNENAISNILVDADFLEHEFKSIGRPHLSSAFAELRLTTSIVLNNAVQDYLVPATRNSSYGVVKHRRLQALLEKLSRYGASQRDPGLREIGERRRKEAEAVGRMYPGETPR